MYDEFEEYPDIPDYERKVEDNVGVKAESANEEGAKASKGDYIETMEPMNEEEMKVVEAYLKEEYEKSMKKK